MERGSVLGRASKFLTLRGRTHAARTAGLLVVAILIPACGIGSAGTLTPTVAPQIPENLTSSAGNHSLTLSWNVSPAAASYTVQRSTTSGGPYGPVPGGSGLKATTFQDGLLTNGHSYFYVVLASNAFGQSQNSAEVSGVPGIFARRAAAGSVHSLALLDDGSLWSWGRNLDGELGNGSSDSLSSVAVPVALNGVVDIAAGGGSMALLNDGSVWTWGTNIGGLLGIGDSTVTNSNIPVRVVFPGGIRMVGVSAAGNYDLCLAENGTVWGWGAVLGPGASYSPALIPGISDVTQISAGYLHVLALKRDGTVWAWGQNGDGQLGDGTTVATSTPQPVPDLTDVVAVGAGYYHSLALGSDGTVWGWGATSATGQGWGTATPKGTTRPTLVPGLSAIKSVGAGSLYSIALRSDGTLWTWGANPIGQLGTGAGASVQPALVNSLAGVETIEAGQNSVLAIQPGGLLWGWGDNVFGSLGNGRSGLVPAPVPAVDLTNLSGVAGGLYFSLGVGSDHSLWSWGTETHGELGDGQALTAAPYRIQVASPPGLNSPVAVAAGQISSLALNGDGTVWSWGYNLNGALGNGSSVSAPPTTFDTPAIIPGLSGITLIAAGGQNGFAVGSGGKVWGWGYNNQGNAGCSASAAAVLTPTPLPGLTGITSIAEGASGGLAVGAGGVVWAWGWNVTGQLGNGTTTGQSNTPVLVPGLTAVVAVATGSEFDLALKSDGTVWAWGGNGAGELGGGSTGASQPVPTQIAGLSNIVAIAAGFDHAMALGSDGSVWVWGDNEFGQYGNGTLSIVATRPPPARVPNLSGVVSIAAGNFSCMAILNDHTMLTWGNNAQGQLAIGSTETVSLPTLITR